MPAVDFDLGSGLGVGEPDLFVCTPGEDVGAPRVVDCGMHGALVRVDLKLE